MTDAQLLILLISIHRSFADAHNKTSTRLRAMTGAIQANEAIKNKYLEEALTSKKLDALSEELLDVTIDVVNDVEENEDLLSPIRDELDYLHSQINAVSPRHLSMKEIISKATERGRRHEPGGRS